MAEATPLVLRLVSRLRGPLQPQSAVPAGEPHDTQLARECRRVPGANSLSAEEQDAEESLLPNGHWLGYYYESVSSFNDANCESSVS